MRFPVGVRVQAVLVVLLFLGLAGAPFFSSVTAFLLPGEEPCAARTPPPPPPPWRGQGGAGTGRFAAASRGGAVPPRLRQPRLSDLTATKCCPAGPASKAAFYLPGTNQEQFTGGAFPT